MVDMFFERMKENGAPIGSAFGLVDGNIVKLRRAILPMHQHTNHFPVHPEIIKKMKEAVDSQEWTAYGGPTGSDDVKKVIAEDLNVDLDRYEIILTNGAIEAMYMIMQHFREEWYSFVDCIPSWPWPRLFMDAYNIPLEYVVRRKIEPDDITPNSCVNLLHGQHPQSLFYTDQELIDIAERANYVNAWILHDKTYRDFFPEYPNLIEQNPDRNFILFSFSKANNMAGLRIGGMVCSKENAKRFFPLNPSRLGVNVIAEKAVIASIETKHLWRQQNIDKLVQNNQYIYDNLINLERSGILTMPKKDIMNDVWIDFHGISSSWVTAELIKRGIRVDDTAVMTYEKRGERGTVGDYTANHITVTTSVPDYWVAYFCEQLNDLLCQGDVEELFAGEQ